MIFDAEGLKPEFRSLIQGFSLVGNAGGENPVESADTIGTNEQDVIAEVIDVAHFTALGRHTRNRGLQNHVTVHRNNPQHSNAYARRANVERRKVSQIICYYMGKARFNNTGE